MGAANLSDEQLLKRASHAGRNLSVLALLATMVTLVFWALMFLANKPPFPMFIPALAATLLAAGYWILAVAARRGDPKSVTVVIVLMVLQLAGSLVLTGIAAARAGTDFSSNFNFSRFIIPILVLIALVGSRTVLIELQDRGLWERAFASAKPSGALWMVGGALLAAGFFALDTGMGYVGAKIGEVRARENQSARAFVQMIRHEEKDFLTAAGTALNIRSKANLDLALSKAAALETKLQDLRTETAQDSSLASVLVTYGNALRQWKNGLLLLKQASASPDIKRANQMIALGDKLRAEAVRDFQQRFGPRSPVGRAPASP